MGVTEILWPMEVLPVQGRRPILVGRGRVTETWPEANPDARATGTIGKGEVGIRQERGSDAPRAAYPLLPNSGYQT